MSLAAVALAAAVAATPAATLLDPAPADAMRPLATDRPTLTFSPLSVDAGHLQLETDVGVASFDGRTAGLTLFGSTLRAGLTDQTDLQVSFPTLGLSHDLVRGAGNDPTLGNFTARLKVNIFGNDGGAFAIGAVPFASFGTGPSTVGVIIPVFVALPADFTLGGQLGGEAIAQNSTETGNVVDAHFLTTVVLNHAVADGVNAYFECQADILTDVATAGTAYRLLGSSGASWLVTPYLQLDAGFRVPLTGVAPTLELFVGTSFRT